MKLTKSKLKQIIKETIEEGLTGSSRWVPTLPEPWKRPSNDLIDAAYQDISTIDAQRGIEAGTYKPEHVADALRTMAAEFDQAAERGGGEEQEPDDSSDDGEYTSIGMPKEDPMGRGEQTSALRRSVMGKKMAEAKLTKSKLKRIVKEEIKALYE